MTQCGEERGVPARVPPDRPAQQLEWATVSSYLSPVSPLPRIRLYAEAYAALLEAPETAVIT